MPWVNQDGPSKLERLIGGLSYLTFGLAGLLYVIVAGRRGQSTFFRFHFLQSIVIGIVWAIMTWASGILVMLLSGILGLLDGFSPGLGTSAALWTGWTVSIVVKAAYLLIVYAMIWAFLGKYAEVPFISGIVRQQMR